MCINLREFIIIIKHIVTCFKLLDWSSYTYSLCLRVPLGNSVCTFLEGGIGDRVIGEGCRYFDSSYVGCSLFCSVMSRCYHSTTSSFLNISKIFIPSEL